MALAGIKTIMLKLLIQQNRYMCIYFIYLFGVLRRFHHRTGHITRVVGRAEEIQTYSSSGFCTVNCRPTASNYQLSHMRLCQEPNPGLRNGRQQCYHSATVAPRYLCEAVQKYTNNGTN